MSKKADEVMTDAATTAKACGQRGIRCGSPLIARGWAIALFAALSGCVSAPPEPDYSATWPEPTPAASAGNGSIYQAGHDIALFENSVARRVGDTLIISMRNLGYSKNAGEFARRFFADIGSAGGHRAMAKAVVPMRAFREKFGELSGEDIGRRLQDLVAQFLHEAPAVEKRRETAGVKT